VWALAEDARAAEALTGQAARLGGVEGPVVLQADVVELPELAALRGEADLRFDAVIGRNAVASSADPAATAAAVHAVLAAGGRLSLAETVTRRAPRPSSLIPPGALAPQLAARLAEAEAAAAEVDPRQAWLEAAGFSDVRAEAVTDAAELLVSPALVERWFAPGAGYATALAGRLAPDEVAAVRAAVAARVGGPAAPWPTVTAYVTARA
jgi:putative ATPase